MTEQILPLRGKKIAVLVESEYIPVEIAAYREQFSALGAQVELMSNLWGLPKQTFYSDAADTGATYLALIIGAIIVMNTMLLSFLERSREFGVLRAVGWSRRRLVLLILGEAVLMALLGAVIGVALSFGVTRVLQEVSGLRGILHADFTAGIFWRALYTAGGIGLLAALYPASRAARLEPLTAMRRE